MFPFSCSLFPFLFLRDVPFYCSSFPVPSQCHSHIPRVTPVSPVPARCQDPDGGVLKAGSRGRLQRLDPSGGILRSDSSAGSLGPIPLAPGSLGQIPLLDPSAGSRRSRLVAISVTRLAPNSPNPQIPKWGRAGFGIREEETGIIPPPFPFPWQPGAFPPSAIHRILF